MSEAKELGDLLAKEVRANFLPGEPGLVQSSLLRAIDRLVALATPAPDAASATFGDCGSAECGWRGKISECSYLGSVGPCCPRCREIVEPDAASEARKVELSDEEIAKIAYKGYDDYWTENSLGDENEAWASSARAVLAAAHGSKT